MLVIKQLRIEKVDEAGKGTARIAQLSAVDNDGDTYAPGAFSWGQGGGQWAQMLPAHNRQSVPLGKAWVYEKDGWALGDFQLNLDTQAGRDWYAALKFDLATGSPVQEWSYGFQVLDATNEQQAGQAVRVLRKLDVDEISPVVRGAGVGTGTMAIKSAELKAARFEPLIASLGEMAAALDADPAILSATGRKQLGEIHAALGKALAPPTIEVAGADPVAVQQILGAYLADISRRHLPR